MDYRQIFLERAEEEGFTCLPSGEAHIAAAEIEKYLNDFLDDDYPEALEEALDAAITSLEDRGVKRVSA